MYLSLYHFLYGFPLIHQSKIASAISSSDHCPASTPPDAGLFENPVGCPTAPTDCDTGTPVGETDLPHSPSRNDILGIGRSVVF